MLPGSDKHRLMGTSCLLTYMITALVASVVSDVCSNRRLDTSVLVSSLFFSL